MTPEFKANIERLPSYFESHFSSKERWYSHKQNLVGLGVPLEEFVMAEWEAGNVVTGNVYMGREGRGEILDLHPINRDPELLGGATVIDFGKDGLYVWDTDAHQLKRSIFGEQQVSDRDISHFFESRIKANEHLPTIGLQEGLKMGDFMEGYQVSDFFIDIDSTQETERFMGDMQNVLADQEFYFGLERFLRRKGLLKPHELIDPKILFSGSNGRIAVSVEGDDKYFNNYWELLKVSEASSDVVGFKNVQYKE